MAIKEFLDNYRDHIVSLSLLEYKNKENIEELEHYSALFDGVCNNHIMLINKIVNNIPPI